MKNYSLMLETEDQLKEARDIFLSIGYDPSVVLSVVIDGDFMCGDKVYFIQAFGEDGTGYEKLTLDQLRKLGNNMKAYKIKVANEAESKQAQELLFELGYAWLNNEKEYFTLLEDHFIVTFSDGVILQAPLDNYNTTHEEHQEITLPQLRDLVILHRNDVGDATHKSSFCDDFYCVGDAVYIFEDGEWRKTVVNPKDLNGLLEKIELQMTQQDAYAQLVCDKKVEFLNSKTNLWLSLIKYTPEFVFKYASNYRLAPQRKTLKGNFTKEQLLKIAGEMN